MENLIKNAEKIPLSYDDFTNLVNPINHHTIEHTDIKVNNLKDFFRGDRAVIVFLPNKVHSVGHWVAFLKHRNNLTSFFDPYGLTYKELCKILGLSPIKFLNDIHLHNTHQLQRYRKTVNTCGRHCAVRCRFVDLNPTEYAYTIGFNRKMPVDDLITILTLMEAPKKIDLVQLLKKFR